MGLFYYPDDLRGYDGLLTFQDVFPTLEDWNTNIGNYLYYNTLDEMENADKLYAQLYDMYKGHYFRYKHVSKIYNVVAGGVEQLIQAVKTHVYLSTDTEKFAGETTITNRYKTDNTETELDEENQINYRTSGETEFISDSKLIIELKKEGVKVIAVMQKFKDEFRTLFMNQTNEVVDKSLYLTKGAK